MKTKKVDLAVSLFGPNDQTLIEVIRHYTEWTTDGQKRRSRPNGWDAITDAYFGKLPSDWPYQSRVVDPLIRTSLVEKKGRLMNQKLRGRLVPRPGSGEANMIKARINNALLDFQWDNANDGGTMLSKWGSMDQDTRMYASDFGLVKWRHEEDKDGNVLFDGNEFYPLDVRDCGLDATCTHIRNAKWFQVRGWEKVEDLERVNDLPNGGKVYPGLADLKSKLAINSNDRRDTAYPNRALQLKGIVDRVGEDRSFPVVEIVTEYREDRWITFSPKYRVILRDIPNPYKHGKIPVVQLRYYKLTGDPWGESEVEPALPLWKSVQAILCGFLDNMNIHNRPPLKIVDGAVRIETIVFGPEAQWLVDRPDAITEFQGSTTPINYFQAAYAAAVSAFNRAMGDLSQGVSQVDPLNNKDNPTATEINRTAQQQNSRDQDNQTQLAESIEDMMSMWVANNQQFIFADPDKNEYVMKIVGSDLYNYFQRVGMDRQELTPEAMQTIGDIIHQQEGNVSDEDLNQLVQSGLTPKFPVFENPKEKNPAKLKYKTKMRMSDLGDHAELSIVPEDLEGAYSYIADVTSMAAGADVIQQKAKDAALERLTTNPLVLQLLQAQGVTPDIKELLITDLEGAGLADAERYFPQSSTIGAGQNPAGQVGQSGTPPPSLQVGGLPAGAPPGPEGGQPNPMAGPGGPQLPAQLSAGI
jgi:hypothetical protein